MTENAKKFLEAVSRNEEEKNTVTAMKTKEEIIAYAKDKGFALTDEDFEQNNAELDEDELGAVAGGVNIYDIIFDACGYFAVLMEMNR